MATGTTFHSDECLLCAICPDVVAQPLSAPCGNDARKACVGHYRDAEDTLHQCPPCNVTLEGSTLAEVPEMIARVESAINARSQRISDIKRSTKKARAFGEQLIRSRPGLAEAIEARRKTAERQAERLVEELNAEIVALGEKHNELQHRLAHPKDRHRGLALGPFLQSLTTLLDEDRTSTVTVDFNLPDATCVRRCAALLSKEIALQRLKDSAADVTLNPDTAHRDLVVSPDGKAVTLAGTTAPQSGLDTDKRFKHRAVLSREGFASGRFYYEVQVKGNTSWGVGVARASVDRRSAISMSVGNGCWVLTLTAGQYRAYGSVSSASSLFVKKRPEVVGIFVDYDEGEVSFYDADAKSLIYTFFGQCFGESLHPYLCTISNAKPLIIAPLTITPLRLPV